MYLHSKKEKKRRKRRREKNEIYIYREREGREKRLGEGKVGVTGVEKSIERSGRSSGKSAGVKDAGGERRGAVSLYGIKGRRT